MKRFWMWLFGLERIVAQCTFCCRRKSGLVESGLLAQAKDDICYQWELQRYVCRCRRCGIGMMRIVEP
jgi:hypothetical protein